MRYILLNLSCSKIFKKLGKEEKNLKHTQNSRFYTNNFPPTPIYLYCPIPIVTQYPYSPISLPYSLYIPIPLNSYNI